MTNTGAEFLFWREQTGQMSFREAVEGRWQITTCLLCVRKLALKLVGRLWPQSRSCQGGGKRSDVVQLVFVTVVNMVSEQDDRTGGHEQRSEYFTLVLSVLMSSLAWLTRTASHTNIACCHAQGRPHVTCVSL